MAGLMKILMGGAAITLLALGTHVLGGEKFASQLDTKARSALADAGIESVDVHMQREPVLSRTAMLHGDLEAEGRPAAQRAVSAIDGIAAARWAASEQDAGGDSAVQSAAESCQTAIDAAIDGRTINFRSGSAYMPDSSVAVARSVADAMKGCGDISLEVAGHSNAGGSEATSQSMSLERAERVMAVMVERGADAARISAKGYGAAQLKVGGTDAEANRANRRVEFVIENAAPADKSSGSEE